MIEVLQGQSVKTMRLGLRIENIGEHHGIDGNTGQFDPGAAQDQGVILDILTDLFDQRILQQRAQPRDDQVLIQLLRHPQVAVADRQIPGTARLDSKGEADQLGFDRIEAGRLGVPGQNALPSSVLPAARQTLLH